LKRTFTNYGLQEEVAYFDICILIWRFPVSINGALQFAKVWTSVYQNEIENKIAAEDSSSARKMRLSPKSHYKTITSIETGMFFAAVARLVTSANGEVASAFLVNAEYDEMLNDQLKGIEINATDRKMIKQRIQTQHLNLMSALNHFGLFDIKSRNAGALNNNVNFYVITPKGRETLKKLESKPE